MANGAGSWAEVMAMPATMAVDLYCWYDQAARRDRHEKHILSLQSLAPFTKSLKYPPASEFGVIE